jgi:hypothetical protein
MVIAAFYLEVQHIVERSPDGVKSHGGIRSAGE